MVPVDVHEDPAAAALDEDRQHRAQAGRTDVRCACRACEAGPGMAVTSLRTCSTGAGFIGAALGAGGAVISTWSDMWFSPAAQVMGRDRHGLGGQQTEDRCRNGR